MPNIAPYSAAAVQAGLALAATSAPKRKPCPARRLVLATLEYDRAVEEMNDAQIDYLDSAPTAPTSVQILNRTYIVEPSGCVMEVCGG